MIKYGYSNIRHLFGNRCMVQMVYDNPICRLGAAKEDQDENGTGARTAKDGN